MTRTLTLLLAIVCLSAELSAQKKSDSLLMRELIQKQLDSLENQLQFKTGMINLPGGIATINVAPGFKFLDSGQARYVIETLWGNPHQEKAPLGLLFPVSTRVTDDGGYAFIIQYETLGYVKDEDADKIDYDELLKDLRKGSQEENQERLKAGLPAMDLVGWAARPRYDKEKKVLYWAKEFSVTGHEINTLNYDVRVLGRKGVLNLQAVSAMNELDSVNDHINDVLGMVSFTEGNKYSDFNSSTDEVAAWTIGGLVAGKVLAKVGFFAIILKYIKLIIAGIALAGGAIWRFISGRKRKKQEELTAVTTDDNPPAA